MGSLKRSISSYLSSEKSRNVQYRRNISVPCPISYNEAEDEGFVDGDECGVQGHALDHNVLECLMDAYGAFTEIYKAIVIPNENFQPRLSDAEILLTDLAYLVTDSKPDALQTVYDILKRIKQACPNLQQQNMTFAMKAIQNAIAILHVNERDHLDNDVMRTHSERDHLDNDVMMTQSRNIMAAVMIINKYLNNLIHRTNSEHIFY
ncbi:uncharacterized protein LOC132730742 [Ruditapes philippinarum]|uniref:uncharacterized protein LOC132730742 n=1 Tax=Ruditapes philippinarum TaxID=129788 RepID=UPI00295BD6E2|nr:uncharacterized protein LOC132730742 [Ruditapes philippinarum]